MELIPILMLSTILFILSIVGLGYCIYKINELSDKVQELTGRSYGQMELSDEVQENNNPEQEYATRRDQEIVTPSDPDIFERFFLRAKENRLLKLGVLFILLGFGWFLSYAFIHNRISPIARIVLGFSLGACCMIFAALRINKSVIQGKLFRVLGAALAVITSYAAQSIYHLFDPMISLGVIFVISIHTAFFAIQYNDKGLVGYGLVTGFLAPIITQSLDNPKLLFSYLVVVSVVGLLLVAMKRWKFINIISLVGFAGFSFPYVLGLVSASPSIHQFILIAMYFVVIAIFIIRIFIATEDDDRVGGFDFVTVILIMYLIITGTLQFVTPQLHSIFFLSRSAFLFVGGIIPFYTRRNNEFFYTYAIASIVSIAIATGIEFSGTRLIYAYTFLGTAISFVGYFITKKLSIGYTLSLLLIVPIFMALPSFASPAWQNALFHNDFGILVVVGFACISLGTFYALVGKRREEDKEKYYLVLNYIGSFFLLSLIRLGSKSLIASPGNAVMVSLIIYTLLGISSYVYGLTNNNSIKYYGTAILLGVILRLALVDVWNMDLIAKIGTFLFIGLLFVSTVFMKKKPNNLNDTTTIPEAE